MAFNVLLLLTATAVSPTFAAAKDASNRGCFKMEDKYFKFADIREFMANGECKIICSKEMLPVAAMSKQNECYCSDRLPQTPAKPEACDAGCTGYGEPCGSITGEYISVFVTGKGKLYTPPVKPSTTSTSATPTKTADAVKSETPTKEPTDKKKEEEKKSSGGVSKGTAAAAAVVSILVAAAIAIGGFILFRRRQRERIEEEYRRTLAARDFTKKPEMDHRLEPVMLHRRDSVGSIADNEDYSRRILKVTNPDG